MTGPQTQTYSHTIKTARTSLAGKKFHFIGAGGIGMSGLAQLMMKNGASITGSDQTLSPTIKRLCGNGAKISIGHTRENLTDDTDAVVISAAIKEDNHELKLARQTGLRVSKYAQMLGEIFNRYQGIAVAGTHGKSTTSGWLTYVLKRIGLDPNFIIGAEVSQLGVSSGTGSDQHFVAEACEYDRSFLNLKPQLACILNIEADHLDYYADEQEIIDAFAAFAGNTKPGGTLIANADDANTAKLIAKLPADLNCQTFGFDETCNFSARNITLIDCLHTFDVFQNGKLLGKTRIHLPGEHNILNALAVVAMAAIAGANPASILELLGEFTGIDRRLTLKAEIDGITILDDYAHHPTEIRASLQAISQRYQPKRIWCVFQPHQYSRTRFLLDDFAESFNLADITIMPEIYFVRDSLESKRQINSEILADRIRTNGNKAYYIDGFTAICNHLKENVTAGDLVVTMGAGDIWKVADEYIHWLRRYR